MWRGPHRWPARNRKALERIAFLVTAYQHEQPWYFSEPASWTPRPTSSQEWAPGYFLGEYADRKLSRRARRRVHKRDRRVARRIRKG